MNPPHICARGVHRDLLLLKSLYGFGTTTQLKHEVTRTPLTLASKGLFIATNAVRGSSSFQILVHTRSIYARSSVVRSARSIAIFCSTGSLLCFLVKNLLYFSTHTHYIVKRFHSHSSICSIRFAASKRNLKEIQWISWCPHTFTFNSLKQTPAQSLFYFLFLEISFLEDLLWDYINKQKRDLLVNRLTQRFSNSFYI